MASLLVVHIPEKNIVSISLWSAFIYINREGARYVNKWLFIIPQVYMLNIKNIKITLNVYLFLTIL